jgi:hypothetical protein
MVIWGDKRKKMKAHKRQKFHVPDLKAKVRTLEALFGEKFMRSKLNPRTVDKWLKEPDPSPYLTSLKKYFGMIGMQESDMLKPKDAFSNKVATIYARHNSAANVQYSPADVIAIYNSFAVGFGRESGVFEQTLKMIQKETIKNDFIYLSGYYHMYHYWKSGDKNDSGKIRRNLIQVYDLDAQQGLIKCRLMISPMKHQQKDDWWVYDGWVVNIQNKLFWLLECVKGMPPEVVSFHVYKPSFWPEPDRFFLHGIVSALSLEGLPCASNILLKKINADDEYKYKIGYFSPQEIEAEGHGIDIVNSIRNVITRTDGVLVTNSGI